MDGRGASSCVMFGSAPSCPSFSVSLLVKLSVAGRGGAGKGGSCVLIPDLVVMAKVGASGFGVSLLLIVQSIWEYCSRSSLRWVVICHPTDHLGIRHILQFESTLLLRSWKQIQALLMGSSSPCLNQRIKSLRAEEKWKNLNLDASLVAPSDYMMWGENVHCKVLGGVGGLGPGLLDEDASSSKRFFKRFR
ncbi:hypothetical protein Tco_0375807 [Tanacetum coccineum]